LVRLGQDVMYERLDQVLSGELRLGNVKPGYVKLRQIIPGYAGKASIV